MRVIEKRAAESVAKPPSPADERTTEDKKKALLDKMKAVTVLAQTLIVVTYLLTCARLFYSGSSSFSSSRHTGFGCVCSYACLVNFGFAAAFSACRKMDFSSVHLHPILLPELLVVSHDVLGEER